MCSLEWQIAKLREKEGERIINIRGTKETEQMLVKTWGSLGNYENYIPTKLKNLQVDKFLGTCELPHLTQKHKRSYEIGAIIQSCQQRKA